MLTFSSRISGKEASHARARNCDTLLFSSYFLPSSLSPMSTNAASSSSTPTPQGDPDIEKILVREASAFQREVEVERILKAFKLKYAFRIYC